MIRHSISLNTYDTLYRAPEVI